jgi:aconitate hydratase
VPGILSILEEHAPRTSARSSAGRVRLNARPDALLADADAGRLALGRFAGLGPGSPAVELIVAADRESAPGWPGGDPESDRFLALARSCGARVLPPRAGTLAGVALDSLAAPGRLLASVRDLAAVGALGAVSCRVGELEAVGVLCGETIEREPPTPRRLRLQGELSPRCEGADVGATLLARWPHVWRQADVEIEDSGLETLWVSDRKVIAETLAAAGARTVLFPSDEITRAFLKSRGREADWRRTDPGPADDSALVLDLGSVVPHAIPDGAPLGPVALAWAPGAPVGEVHVGSEALIEDLVRLGELFEGRRVLDRVRFTIRCGSARIARAARTLGLVDTLTGCGVRFLADDEPDHAMRRIGELSLRFGSPRTTSETTPDWSAGLQACVAAAFAGALEEPSRPSRDGNGALAGTALESPINLAGAAAASASPNRVLPSAKVASWVGLRGLVRARWEDDLDGERLLPHGPRVRAWLDRPEHLASEVLPGAVRELRPQTSEGWLVVRGAVRELENAEAGLLALRALGVRAVLAEDVEPAARRRCAEAGLLAMKVERAADLAEIARGDELELVGGLELVALERSRVVRNLTRARVLVTMPEHDETEWEWVRRGGRLGPASLIS